MTESVTSGNGTREHGGSSAGQALQMERVIGLTTLHNASLSAVRGQATQVGASGITTLTRASVDPSVDSIDADDGKPGQGTVVYAAGCFAVAYDSVRNRQTRFFRANKAIASLCYSDDGTLLAVGERGHQPSIFVWDVASHGIVAEFRGHKFGVGCMTFSPDKRLLVSVGFKPDKALCVWNLETSQRVSRHKIANKVYGIDFHASSEFFVTCGDRHVKFWSVRSQVDPAASLSTTYEVKGKPASILEEHLGASFLDVACGRGSVVDSTFAVTSTGVLCVFTSNRLMERWVSLDSPTAYCLSLWDDNLLAVGCANGTVRLFDPVGLEYVNTLPLPAPLQQGLGASGGPLESTGSRSRRQRERQARGTGGGEPEDNGEDSTDDDDTEDASDELESEGDDRATHESGSRARSTHYPAAYGVRFVDQGSKLAVVYADRSLFVWNTEDAYSVSRLRSFLHHSACIWDVQFALPSSVHEDGSTSMTESGRSTGVHGSANANGSSGPLPPGTFITCAGDNTIRFWNLDPEHAKESRWHSPYSSELLHTVVLAESPSSLGSPDNSANAGVGPSSPLLPADRALHGAAGGTGSSATSIEAAAQADRGSPAGTSDIPDLEIPSRPHAANAPRCLCVHPGGRELACGDRQGSLLVFNLGTMQLTSSLKAHDAEVLSLHFSPVLQGASGTSPADSSSATTATSEGGSNPFVLLATAGRDRMVQIYDASRSYAHTQSLENHSSSVTSVLFTGDGQRLLSCGGDKTMVFSTVVGSSVQRVRSVAVPRGTIYGMAVDATNKYAVTSGQDKKLNIWNLASGKQMRSYRLPGRRATELYKVDVDHAGIFVATCAFDKSIRIFDFFSGECIASAGGHSELVTGVRFSPDGKRLVSICGDGCIFVWKLGTSLVNAMQDRLVELSSHVVRRERQRDRGRTPTSEPSNLPLPQPPSAAKQAKAAAEAATVAGSDSVAGSAAVLSKHAGRGTRGKWAERVVREGGFQLLGGKLQYDAEHGRNHLTLELSDSASHPVSPDQRSNAAAAAAGATEAEHRPSEPFDVLTSVDSSLASMPPNVAAVPPAPPTDEQRLHAEAAEQSTAFAEDSLDLRPKLSDTRLDAVAKAVAKAEAAAKAVAGTLGEASGRRDNDTTSQEPERQTLNPASSSPPPPPPAQGNAEPTAKSTLAANGSDHEGSVASDGKEATEFDDAFEGESDEDEEDVAEEDGDDNDDDNEDEEEEDDDDYDVDAFDDESDDDNEDDDDDDDDDDDANDDNDDSGEEGGDDDAVMRPTNPEQETGVDAAAYELLPGKPSGKNGAESGNAELVQLRNVDAAAAIARQSTLAAAARIGRGGGPLLQQSVQIGAEFAQSQQIELAQTLQSLRGAEHRCRSALRALKEATSVALEAYEEVMTQTASLQAVYASVSTSASFALDGSVHTAPISAASRVAVAARSSVPIHVQSHGLAHLHGTSDSTAERHNDDNNDGVHGGDDDGDDENEDADGATE